MTSQTGQQIIAINILPNISRSKGNKTMKFGQSIEYNIRNFSFLKKHIQNVAEKIVTDPFINYQNWGYLRVNSLKCYKVFFFICASQGLPKYNKTKVLTCCFYDI